MHLVIKEQGKAMRTHVELAGVMGDILQLDIQGQDVVLAIGGAELLAHRDPGILGGVEQIGLRPTDLLLPGVALSLLKPGAAPGIVGGVHILARKMPQIIIPQELLYPVAGGRGLAESVEGAPTGVAHHQQLGAIQAGQVQRRNVGVVVDKRQKNWFSSASFVISAGHGWVESAGGDLDKELRSSTPRRV